MTGRLTASVRGVWADLVERRLWPVAVALVALFVAVPVLFGGSAEVGEPAPPPSIAAAPGSGAPATTPAITVEGAAVTGRKRPGAVRNPFFDPPEPETAGTGEDDTVTPTGTGAGPAPAPAPRPQPAMPDRTVAPAGPTPTPPAAPRKRAAPIIDERYTVSLRFGGPGKVAPIAGLQRLSPLPSAKDPFFVFVGVLRGGKVARFLVSSDVKATGDGTCRPRKSLCETIDMRPGDTQFFDFDLGPDGARQYQMDLTAIRLATDRDSAPAPRAQTSGAPGSFDVLRADVRFGSAGAAARTRRDVARLAPFPSEGTPVAQFLGALADRRTAIFMVAPGVTPVGSGDCLNDEDCRVLALRTGESATLRSAAGEHRLDLLSLRRTIARRASLASRAHRREHPAGRRVMRALIADRHTAGALGRFAFSPRLGTVKRR